MFSHDNKLVTRHTLELNQGSSLPTMPAQPSSSRSAARKKRKHNPISGLPKDVLETLSTPTLEGSEGDIVPEDLVYIGSYNWVLSEHSISDTKASVYTYLC